jgi:hypothetical protein
METSEERSARNEVSFREANESLEDKRRELDVRGLTPFLCECDDPGCTELVLLTLAEYERVRSHPNWFVIVAGHEPDSETAEEHERYAVVEKEGAARRIAEEENPRM